MGLVKPAGEVFNKDVSIKNQTPSLFGTQDAYGGFVPCDQSVSSVSTPRLSNQCQRILERLQKGSATNRELAEISLKYTGRISDLRSAGYLIRCEENKRTGISVYRLAEC